MNAKCINRRDQLYVILLLSKPVGVKVISGVQNDDVFTIFTLVSSQDYFFLTILQFNRNVIHTQADFFMVLLTRLNA